MNKSNLSLDSKIFFFFTHLRQILSSKSNKIFNYLVSL